MVVGMVAFMLVYLICWKPEVINVDSPLNRTLSDSKIFLQGTLKKHIPTPSILRDDVAIARATGQASTSTEASQITDSRIYHAASHNKRDGASRHTRRGFFGWLQAEKSPRIEDFPGCDGDGKPYTRNLKFALKRPDGTLDNQDPIHTAPVFNIWTNWELTYPNMLLKAVLDDPTKSAGCPRGHCMSRAIPGADGLRLTQVGDFGERSYSCYNMMQGNVWRMWTLLGVISRVHGDFVPAQDLEIISFHTQRFIAERMQTTYPTLEVSLVAALTVGLFVVLPIVLWVGYRIYRIVAPGAKRGYPSLRKCCKRAHRQCVVVGAVCERYWGRIKMRRRGTPVTRVVGVERIGGSEEKDIGSEVLPSYSDATREWRNDLDDDATTQWRIEMERMV